MTDARILCEYTVSGVCGRTRQCERECYYHTVRNVSKGWLPDATPANGTKSADKPPTFADRIRQQTLEAQRVHDLEVQLEMAANAERREADIAAYLAEHLSDRRGQVMVGITNAAATRQRQWKYEWSVDKKLTTVERALAEHIKRELDEEGFDVDGQLHTNVGNDKYHIDFMVKW